MDLSQFNVVVVQGSPVQNPEIGNALAELVAQQLKRSGVFLKVVREADQREALHLGIEVSKFRKGSVAARLKYGRLIGQASLKVKVEVWSSVRPSQRDRFVIGESTLLTSPHAGRTGREDFRWLQREVARQITSKFVSETLP